MNNVLPRVVKMHLKFDLKGSTYKRRASRKEKEKSLPTYKDLDFMQDMPEGLLLDADTFGALVKTLQRDCLVRSAAAPRPAGCPLPAGVHPVGLPDLGFPPLVPRGLSGPRSLRLSSGRSLCLPHADRECPLPADTCRGN